MRTLPELQQRLGNACAALVRRGAPAAHCARLFTAWIEWAIRQRPEALRRDFAAFRQHRRSPLTRLQEKGPKS